jgi:predicted DNA-binding protein
MEKTTYPTLQEVLDKRNTIRVATWISPELKRQVDAMLARTGTPISWQIRNLLETWIAQQQNR